METTALEIMKKLSGQVSNLGGAISGVKHGIEDMKKEAEKANQNKNIQTQQLANQNSQQEVESKQFQSEGFKSRIESASAPQAEPQVESKMEGGNK